MKYKLSEWYSGDVKPVYDGVYHRSAIRNSNFAKFKNGKWYLLNYTIKDAANEKVISLIQNDYEWRGIVK